MHTALLGCAPPAGLLVFYWHHVRQIQYLFGAMLLTSLAVLLIDTMIQGFLGKLERLMQAAQRSVALADAFQSFSPWPRWWPFAGLAARQHGA